MLDNWEIVKFLASFAIMVIILYALYYYAHNFTPKIASPKKKYIQIVESKIIGKNRFLMLVKVKDTILLLSLDEGGIKVLQKWEKESS